MSPMTPLLFESGRVRCTRGYLSHRTESKIERSDVYKHTVSELLTETEMRMSLPAPPPPPEAAAPSTLREVFKCLVCKQRTSSHPPREAVRIIKPMRWSCYFRTQGPRAPFVQLFSIKFLGYFWETPPPKLQGII